MNRSTTLVDYVNEARERFGDNPRLWRFVCPVCGHEQSGQDYKDAEAPDDAIGFSCVGRWIEGSRDAFGSTGIGPCNYAGGGLISLSPVSIIDESTGDEYGFFELASARQGGAS